MKMNNEILNNSIFDLRISDVFSVGRKGYGRVLFALISGSDPITTIGKLIQYSGKELLKRRNFGKKSLQIVNKELKLLGMELNNGT